MHDHPKFLVEWLGLSDIVRVRVRARDREWIFQCFFFPLTMPPAICAQSFEPTLAWATPIPDAIIISIWRSQTQNITESLLISKEPSSGMDFLKT